METFQINDVVMAPMKGSSFPVQGDVLALDPSKNLAYVRFRNQDKRLDDWIPYKQLQFISHGAAKTEKKRKRNEDGEENFEEESPIRNLDSIQYGKYNINCWYYSPYLSLFTENRHMYVCDTCCLYFKSKEEFMKHGHKKECQRPPGREIYRCGNISMFEVSGAKHKVFCQCLSLLSKLFLDDVAVFYNVCQFNFFVLCECDEFGAHVVSFFSRDYQWRDNNILACILVLPPWQKHGYGRLMISIAYEIARRNRIVGGPEKPLSDLGKLAFKAYWRDTIIKTMFEYKDKIRNVDDFQAITSIAKVDLLKTMKDMNLLYHTNEGWTTTLNIEEMKHWIENGPKPIPSKFEFQSKMLTWIRGID
ncbi:MOZ/SAS family protein [Trichomonas vaginalis G3]|uniref:Histone acetyltransferase n=1 Tax=Trichomonas vaginalis (strain ATCC PRA-98 / G3) TaxID=412133 RepID=A2E091_TRIV3|nr:histone acetyltransferase protein [Trichomonas vaginalis G3]EAY13891.1 MOZ/SAS family protein [Trichomonas vaginalis G3]KAI5520925.1 histone acetyltransferase protein [Trichomonas vaginalis G3]|eukprot:XP_001326114.1 MOZ/SAS family protein [Trichomonas vaginalis G3]